MDLTSFVEKAAGLNMVAVIVSKDGEQIAKYNWDDDCRRNVYSAAKSFTSAAVGIAVREGNPVAVMTSYNLLNGVHTSQHRGLIEDILRGEFGFDGIVMTDWVTGGSVLSKNAKYPVPHAGEVAAAGGDLFMPGSKKKIREITEALRDGRLRIEQLRINASRVIRAAQRLQQGGTFHV